MEKCKYKAIQTNLDIFTHNMHIQGLFWHIQAYVELCVTLAYSEHCHNQNQRHIQKPAIFRTLTLAYSEHWYFQNSGIFRTRDIFRALGIFSTRVILKTSTMERFVKTVKDYNIFPNFCNTSFSSSLLYEMNIISIFIQA